LCALPDQEPDRPTAHHAFLSHSSRDRQQVERLARDLQEKGVRPWLDVWDLPLGVAWQPVLEEALRRIPTIVVVDQFEPPLERHQLVDAIRRPALAVGSDVEDPVVDVRAAAFSSDGSLVVTASADQTLRLWPVTQRPEPWVLDFSKDDLTHTVGADLDALLQAVLAPDETQVATIDTTGVARTWQVQTGTPTDLAPTGTTFSRIQYSPDGQLLALGTDGVARTWSSRTGLVERRAGDRALVAGAFSPDGRRIVAVGMVTGETRIHRVDGKGEAVTLVGHGAAVVSIAFSPDGRHVVTASNDTTVRVWSTDGAGDPLVLRGHTRPLLSAAFSANGHKVLTASRDGTARLWSIVPEEIQPFLERSEPCLSPDQRQQYLGESLATASRSFEACEDAWGRRTGVMP